MGHATTERELKVKEFSGVFRPSETEEMQRVRVRLVGVGLSAPNGDRQQPAQQWRHDCAIQAR